MENWCGVLVLASGWTPGAIVDAAKEVIRDLGWWWVAVGIGVFLLYQLIKAWGNKKGGG